MITGDLRNKVDRIWEIFWTGGITNPLEVIEQFTYLLFIKQLDDVESAKENDAIFLGLSFVEKEYTWTLGKQLIFGAKIVNYKNGEKLKKTILI